MSEQDTREKLEADVRYYAERCNTLSRENADLQANVDSLTADAKRWADAANAQRLVAMEQADRVQELTAERDELQAAIDAMGNGQFYAMYRAKCEECEEAVSFAKRLENAVKDGQPVTLFGVGYSPTVSMREQEKLKKKLHRLRRRLAKAKQQRDYLQKVVKTQAESFKKLEIELAQARGEQ